MIQYTIGWLIRLACLIACVFLRGWLLLVPAIIAIGAPLVLVVLANAVGSTKAVVKRPGGIVRRANPSNPR